MISPKGLSAIRWNASPIVGEDGNIMEIQASGRDVTEAILEPGNGVPS